VAERFLTGAGVAPLLKEIRHNPLLWLLVLVPLGLGGTSIQARSACTAVCALRRSHRALGSVAEPRHRVRGGQDGRHNRRITQRNAGKSDRTSPRAPL
jgi:hypothetical protein